MKFFDFSLFVEVYFGVPFTGICLGVLIAVFGKAARKFPFQPDEEEVFTRPPLPRSYSRIYVVQPPPRPRGTGATHRSHENTYPQRPRRDGG